MNKLKIVGKFFKETKIGKGLVSAGVGLVEGLVPGAATFLKPNKESDLGLTKNGEYDKIRLVVALVPLAFIVLSAFGLVPEEASAKVLEYVTSLLA